MQNQFVRGASIFISLCVRELPPRELFPNCILVIQSTKGKCSLPSLKFPNRKSSSCPHIYFLLLKI